MVDRPTVQSFKLVKDSEQTKRKMLIFCMVLIFALILTTFGISRNRDAFCIMSPADDASKVKIVSTVSAIMFVRKVKLSPSVFLTHAKALENVTAKYPINRVMCKTLTIPANLMDVNHEKSCFGQIPIASSSD